jgi:hypothetical protein
VYCIIYNVHSVTNTVFLFQFRVMSDSSMKDSRFQVPFVSAATLSSQTVGGVLTRVGLCTVLHAIHYQTEEHQQGNSS